MPTNKLRCLASSSRISPPRPPALRPGITPPAAYRPLPARISNTQESTTAAGKTNMTDNAITTFSMISTTITTNHTQRPHTARTTNPLQNLARVYKYRETQNSPSRPPQDYALSLTRLLPLLLLLGKTQFVAPPPVGWVLRTYSTSI